MKLLLAIVVTCAGTLATPAWSQAMDHSTMPGMTMPVPKPAAPPKPAADPACPPEHAAMGHCTPKAPAPAPSAAPAEATPAVGSAPAPTAPQPDYADRIWGRDAMAPARAAMRKEHGGGTFSQVMINLAEYQFREGRDGYRWDGEGWFGGDIDRFVVKSEGSGNISGGIEDAEVQALYSRAVGPYFNLQAGIRHDVRPRPARTYATIGFEGLAPYWFEVEGALFLSDKGDVLARLEGYYDQRITQRLILQPRAEVNLSAQDIRRTGTGSGMTDVELGLRLRYEIAREFAPYVGVTWDRKIGDTARFARSAGDRVSSPAVALGIRTWF